jgi:hypothetical protein
MNFKFSTCWWSISLNNCLLHILWKVFFKNVPRMIEKTSISSLFVRLKLTSGISQNMMNTFLICTVIQSIVGLWDPFTKTVWIHCQEILDNSGPQARNNLLQIPKKTFVKTEKYQPIFNVNRHREKMSILIFFNLSIV